MHRKLLLLFPQRATSFSSLKRDLMLLKYSTTTSTVTTMSSTEQQNFIIKVDDAKNFVKDSMIAVGTKVSHAQALADLLVLADQRGHYSHGLNRLGEWNIISSLQSPSLCALSLN